MRLKWVLIMYSSGVPLFSYNVETREAITDMDLINVSRVCGFYNVHSYINHYLLDEPCDYILTDGFLWVIHEECIHHYASKEEIEEIRYSVVVVAEIGKSEIEISNKKIVSLLDYIRVLLEFAKEISLMFANECAKEIEIFSQIRLEKFKKFKPHCEKRCSDFTAEIAEALNEIL